MLFFGGSTPLITSSQLPKFQEISMSTGFQSQQSLRNYRIEIVRGLLCALPRVSVTCDSLIPPAVADSQAAGV